MKRSIRVAAVAALLTLGAAGTAQAQFNINVNFSGGLTPTQEAVFTTAAGIWESLITGYQPGISITGITINAGGPFIDGPGGVLGNASPDFGVNQGGFTLTTSGHMNFDSADLAAMESGGYLLPVILHEMGHVIGIGTLWTNNNVYIDGTGQYTGAYGLAAYQTEFNQPGAAFIPVEMGGGPGTADAHWNETDGGAGLTPGIDSVNGNMTNELMTGWLNTPYFISDMTVQSLRDIGFTVVPTPGAAALVGLGGLAMGRRRRS